MQTIIIVIAFLAYISFREWMHYQQVNDLEIKLIAKNSDEIIRLKEASKVARIKPKEEEPEEDPDLVDAFGVASEEAISVLNRTEEV